MRDVLSGCGESNVSQKAAWARPHAGAPGAVVDVLGVVEVEVVPGEVVDVGGELLVVDEVLEGAPDVLVLGDVVEDVEGASDVVVDSSAVVELVDDDVTSVVEELSAPQLPAGGWL